MAPKKPANYYLMKLNRAIVWVLLVLMILLLLTGYGLAKPNLIYALTGGLIDWRLASSLHSLLDIYLVFFLVLHVIIEIKFTLMRWGFKKQKLLNLLMIMLGSSWGIFLLYVEMV
jgi:thiosulfate reductase cytochrome b subunit